MNDTLWKPTDEPDIIAAEHIIASAHYKSKDWTDVYLVPVAQYHALAARMRAVERDRELAITEKALLCQQLAEAHGMVERLKNDPDYQQCCELRNQAEQQVARLREAAMQAVVDEPEMPGEMPNKLYQAVHALDREGLAEWYRIMVRATKRRIADRLEHALRETGAGKEDATVTAHRVGCATAEQIEQYIRMADAELGPECVDAWVEDIRQFLRTRYNTR